MPERVRRIPIAAAKRIAENYGYDQVIIFAAAREEGRSHTTTYGRTKAWCREAARAGDIVCDLFGDQSTGSLRKLRIGLTAEIARREAEGETV